MAKKSINKSVNNRTRYGYSPCDNFTHIVINIITHAPSVAFSIFFLYATFSLSSEKIEVIFTNLFEKESTLHLYVIIGLMAIAWFVHVRLIRQLHSSNMRAAGTEKSRLQTKLAGRDLGSSDD